MPAKAKSICTYPGCNRLGFGRRCDLHPYLNWDKRGEPTKRIINGEALMVARKRLFEAEPLCVHCKAAGIVRLAAIRDHIIPLAEGGPDIESNTQGLCKRCHDIKSSEESQRGRRRA